jgi:hypothetical protein
MNIVTSCSKAVLGTLCLLLLACGEEGVDVDTSTTPSVHILATAFTSSPSGTIIPGANQIVDSNGGVWTLSSGVPLLNGVSVALPIPAVALVYYANAPYSTAVYQQTASCAWYIWYTSQSGTPLNGPWTQTAAPPVGNLPACSPNAGASGTGGGTGSGSGGTSTPSASGTTIPTATQLIDSSGNVWTVSGGAIYLNGNHAGSSANTALLLYYNGVIYTENNQGGWWSWNGSDFAAVSGDPRGTSSGGTGGGSGGTSTPSTSGTTIPTATQLIDSSSNVWTVSGGAIYLNGNHAGASANTALLLYYNGVIYTENNQGGWWSWNGSDFAAVSGDPRGTSSGGTGSGSGGTSTPSASGTTIPTATQLIDSIGNVWTVSGGAIYMNGNTAGSLANITLLLYYDGVIYTENNQGSWWSWNGSGFVAVSGDPRGTSSSAGSGSWSFALDSSHNALGKLCTGHAN